MKHKNKFLIRVDGSKEIGLGHVYNMLTFLNNIKNEEILIVMNSKSNLGSNKFRKYGYKLKLISNNNDLIRIIRNFNPDVICNDILNTNLEYMKILKNNDCVIVNFEDLGEGRKLADLVFNPIYYTKNKFKNEFYGEQFACVREEFRIKKRNRIRKKVKKIAPDILLSIYFTGPGTTGALCNYHPHIVMALGSDVLIEMKQSLLYRIISKFTIYRTDRFVAVSKYIADTLCEEGVSKKDVFINPIGVDTRTFNYIEPKDKNENLQLVSTRKIDPNYNIKQFIDSLPIVYNNHNNLSVKITSSGSEFEQIKKSITKY